jgi:hypothetical protein
LLFGIERRIVMARFMEACDAALADDLSGNGGVGFPREMSAFELQAFFTFERSEREVIGARRSNVLKLGLALHIGFSPLDSG